MKKLVSRKRGQVTLYLAFIIAGIVIITIGAFVGPLGTMFNTKMYLAGQDILNKTLPDIELIQDETIRTQINDSINSAIAASVVNIEVSTSLFQYSWILLLVSLALIVFLATRQLVEFGGGSRGGFV